MSENGQVKKSYALIDYFQFFHCKRKYRITHTELGKKTFTRVYDVEGGAIFSKNSTFVFFDGAARNPLLRSPCPLMAPG